MIYILFEFHEHGLKTCMILFEFQAPDLPPPHFQRTVCIQWKDPKEKKDHVWQDEVNQFFEFEVEGDWKDIGMPEIAEMGGMENLVY